MGDLAMFGLMIALTHAPTSSLTLAIDIGALEPMSHALRRSMIDETAALWKPYDVALTWIAVDASRGTPPFGMVRVLKEGCRVEPLCAPTDRRRLGAVVFRDESATPDNTLMLSVATVVDVVARVTWHDRRLTDLPAQSRDHLIGRALGRVLAHEIGHYVLGIRRHSANGLMRSEFRGDQLIGPSRGPFEVPAAEMPLLQIRLAQLTTQQPLARETTTGW